MKVNELAVVCALALVSGGCALPRPWGDTIDLHTLLSGGGRVVQHDDFDGHAYGALALVTRDPASGWGYELGASYGAEDADDGARTHEAEFDELSFGMRYTWKSDERSTRPYVGFGGSFARLEHELESPSSSFDDDGGGAYACTGVLWSLGRIWFDPGSEVVVGVDVRAFVGDDYDYEQVGLVLGFGN